MRPRRLSALLALAAVLSSCDSPSGPTPAGAPAHLDVVSGDQQSAVVGTELPAPLVVKVTDDKGKAIKGQVVSFRVTAGNGTVFAGTALTDASGQAQERWTLGTVARDTQKVEARAVDAGTGAALVFAAFRAVGRPDAPASLSRMAGDAQTGPAGAALADSLAVKLADRYGNGVPGQAVAFAVTGGGSVSPAARATDSSGVARAQWTLGTRVDSVQSAAATFGALASATFGATATVSGTLAKGAGDGQSGTVGAPLPDSLAVRLTTAGGAPLRGATIQWSTGSDGAALVPATSQTDAGGVAKASWLLGRHSGAQTAAATVVGTTQAVSFTATAAAGPAAYFTIGDGYDQTGDIWTALPVPLLVRVHDLYGNPAVTTPVSWTAADGLGTFSPAVSFPDSAGDARTTWTLGPLLGTQKAEARTPTLGPLVFSATGRSAGPLVIDSPYVGRRVSDTVHVRVLTASSLHPATVTAAVEGRTVSLVPAGSRGTATLWTGTLVLTGLARGDKVLTVTATRPDGSTYPVAEGITYDRPPTVVISAPVPNLVVPLQVHVTGSCADDDPAGCVSTSVNGYYFQEGGYPQLATAAGGSFDGTVTLDPTLDGRPVILQLDGADSRGQHATASVKVDVENAVTGWTRIGFTQGVVRDLSTDRLLFTDSAGGVESLKMIYRASGTRTTLWTGAPGHEVRYAYIGPHGAIFQEALNGISAVHEWRDGVLDPSPVASTASELQVSGTWAAYVQLVNFVRSVHRRDLQTGADVALSGATAGTVGPNGDVVYYTSSYDVYRYRSGVTTLVAAHTTDSIFVAPVTDGTGIVYLKRPRQGLSGQIILNEAGTEVVLTSSTTLPQALDSYRIAGGWTAYVQVPSGGAQQVWVRSPAGVSRQVAQGSACKLQALSTDGTVIYDCGDNRLYIARPGAAPTYLARWRLLGGPVFLPDGTLAIMVAGSAFQVPF